MGGKGGGKPMNVPRPHQTFDSNGPDIRVRGNAHQVMEKYLAMARDAASQGDRVAAENFYQHAEHYFRVINAQQQQYGQQRPRHMPTPAEDQAPVSEDEDQGGAVEAADGGNGNGNGNSNDEGQAQAVNA